MDPDILPISSPDTFPWPAADDHSVSGSAYGIIAAMDWPGLTLPERCVAMFVGDGMGGTPDSVRRLAVRLNITEDETMELLWALLRKGFLTRVAGWWSA